MIKITFPYQFILAGITDKELSASEVADVLSNWIPALCSSAGPIDFVDAVDLGRFIAEMRAALLAGDYYFEPSNAISVRTILRGAKVEPRHAQAAYLVNLMLESDGREG